jgi:carbohydrate kinase (thermoresistant glucokinase family)
MGGAVIIILMGIAGAGKSTIGRLLADRMGVRFAEGDVYHPPENVSKMSTGQPLSDEDRFPWLRRMAADILMWSDEGLSAVLSCSALKKSYRTILAGNNPQVCFVHLHGAADLVRERMARRRDHFMPTSLIDSQLATLEMPEGEANVLTLDIAAAPEEIVEAIIRKLHLPVQSEGGSASGASRAPL